MDALKRDLEALGIALEVEPELPDVSGDHERERILTLVSKEVGIPMEALHHMAPSNLAQSLPEVEIPDWKPEEKRLDVARAVARIVGQEQQKTGQVDLLMAFSQRFEDEFLMLHALLVGVGNCSGEKALRNARVALALPAAPAEAKDIKGYLAENELAQAFVALKDLPPREGVTAQLINLVAIALRNAGLNLEAEWLYRQGLRATPNRLSLLFNFARLKMDQDQPALAARLLRKALSIDPRHDASQRLLEQAKALAEGTPTAAAG